MSIQDVDDWVLPSLPLPVRLADLAVAVPVGMLRPLLQPQPLHGQVLPRRQFLAHCREIEGRPPVTPSRPRGPPEEPLLQLRRQGPPPARFLHQSDIFLTPPIVILHERAISLCNRLHSW